MSTFSLVKPGSQQNHKTKQYWDTFYTDLPVSSTAVVNQGSNSDSGFEWIAANSPVLLDEIIAMYPSPSKNDAELKVLEIGCGVSELSKVLLQRLIQQRSTLDDRISYRFVVTDVSEICIGQNRCRDADFIASLAHCNGLIESKNEQLMCNNDSFQYETLDILTTSPTQQYNVILDKGTLDTFLFRSKRVNKGNEPYPPLLLPLLNNIHGWLRNGGRYIIISPRGKIKAVRDFRGFSLVRRVALDACKLGGSILLESNANGHSKSKNVYIYECVRNDQYNVGDEAFDSQKMSFDDQATCPQCQQSFRQFRGNVKIEDQGTIVWGRKWKNHIVHCRQ